MDELLAAYQESAAYPALAIAFPAKETLFPPDIVPATFSWTDAQVGANAWLILFEFTAGKPLPFVTRQKTWTPRPRDWEKIKNRSTGAQAKLTILGFASESPNKILSRGQSSMSTSPDPVDAAIFYREVNLPFMEAVKDPTRIRWRYGTISSPEPPKIILEHLPVCGNCHSFSGDGRVLGMDVDYANSKGSYVITRVRQQMALSTSDIITWDDYQKNEREKTFGLLSQVSPDGQVVVSTVKDKSVFVARPELAFSQLFFPIKGILVVYHRRSGSFRALPGADDPRYVQSNPSWSPDGKFIVFARAPAYELKNPNARDKILLSAEDCEEFLKDGKPFLFDLYRIPYNNGQGGTPEPLAGASRNGRSNFFAKYSPDGKWIVFCQAKSYMLLQPDSELYIIPAEGGTSRRLQCNTSRLNSWHSWSPNSRWLVFSSKANSPYTQLFLTHIDEKGDSTPPVLLAHFTAPDRAANIPEFVNGPPGAITRIQQRFLDDNSRARAAYVFEMTGDVERAIAEYQKALELNPNNAHAHQRLGFLLYHAKQQLEQGLAHTSQALKIDPTDACAHFDLGTIFLDQKKPQLAIPHLTKAVELLPEGLDQRYNTADMHYSLSVAYVANHQIREASDILGRAIARVPKDARLHYTLALTWAVQGLIQEPMKEYGIARALNPALDTSPHFHDFMALNYAKAGQFTDALERARRALQLAEATRDTALVDELKARIEEYRKSSSAP